MNRTSKIIISILILILMLLGCAIFAMVWSMNHYVWVDLKAYPKDLPVLDLRNEQVSISKYQRLQRNLPDCQILWNIPFQNSQVPHDTQELTVNTFSQEDLNRLSYFSQLKVLNAPNCTDYDTLLKAARAYPQLQVNYTVTIGESGYTPDTRMLRLAGITQEEISLLSALPKLETVILTGTQNIQDALSLQGYCEATGIDFCVALGSEDCSTNAEQVITTGITDAQLELLQLMPDLKMLHITDPVASAENLLALRSRSDLILTWDKTICGKVYPHTATEVDLSDAQIGTLEEVEQAMAYLPDAESLFLGLCGLDNEEISAYRERSRDQYKVVWVVDLSGKMQVRTDITNFMPSRDGWGYVRDHEIDNIRYCEDLICIDIGHMGIRDVSFLEPLVNLEYLILAHTEVQYIDAISNCKKLKYLELDWSPIKDVSPLLECKALEDLNVGMAWPDITPLLQMTWLKNLYIIKGNTRANFAEALPNTRVVATGEYTVSNGWRNLPNYYAMRDILGMYYM